VLGILRPEFWRRKRPFIAVLTCQELENECDVLSGADVVLNGPRYTKEDFREIAAALEVRLKKMDVSQSERFSKTSLHKRVRMWWRNAYRKRR